MLIILQNIHCIGDKANNVVLNIFEDLLTPEDVRRQRPRIEHAQIMTLADLQRFARLGGAADNLFVRL